MQKKVLVVDDEPNIVISLKFLLENAGFDVKSESDGQSALDAIASSTARRCVRMRERRILLTAKREAF